MKEKKKPIKKVYRKRDARLTITCSSAQKKKIKRIAESRDMSITDFMLSLVEEKHTGCPLGLNHTPNSETIASIEASEKGEGIKRFKSIDDLFEDLGL